MRSYLNEIECGRLGTKLIEFTGGEPCMNPELPRMLDGVLHFGRRLTIPCNVTVGLADTLSDVDTAADLERLKRH